MSLTTLPRVPSQAAPHSECGSLALRLECLSSRPPSEQLRNPGTRAGIGQRTAREALNPRQCRTGQRHLITFPSVEPTPSRTRPPDRVTEKTSKQGCALGPRGSYRYRRYASPLSSMLSISRSTWRPSAIAGTSITLTYCDSAASSGSSSARRFGASSSNRRLNIVAGSPR